MPRVFDQGQLGSCTANAVGGRARVRRHARRGPAGHARRLFIYYCERQIEGSLGKGDTGAFGRDGFKAAKRFGTPPETDWPYDITKYADDPPQPAWQDAAAHRLTKSYKSVARSVNQFKRCSRTSRRSRSASRCTRRSSRTDVAKTGIVPMPAPDEQQLGGHEVLAVGYLAGEPNYVLVRNSWGSGWGLGGYFLMPWAVPALDRPGERLSHDRAAVDVSGRVATAPP